MTSIKVGGFNCCFYPCHRLDHFDLLGSSRRQGAKSILIRFIAICLVAFSVHAETLNGYVIEITDGDTIVALDANHKQRKIRLAGIDAPEKANSEKAPETAQPFGERSKQNLASIVQQECCCRMEQADRYGRTVGKVMVNGIDANLAQIKAGMAWWYEKYRKEQSPADQRTYAQAEQQARLQQVGLWRVKNPIPPWEFRHAKDGVQQEQSCPCSISVNCTGPKGGQYCPTEGGSKNTDRKDAADH